MADETPVADVDVLGQALDRLDAVTTRDEMEALLDAERGRLNEVDFRCYCETWGMVASARGWLSEPESTEPALTIGSDEDDDEGDEDEGRALGRA